MNETIAAKRLSSIITESATMLQRRWIPIWRILTFSLVDDLILPQKNLSISIEKGRLSVAYGTRFLSRITIKDVKEYPFEEGRYPQPADLVSCLSLTVRETGAIKSDITLSIPKAWTIFRTVELPSSARENLPGVVSYEMDRITPLSSDEVFFDFRVLKDEGERLTLLIMVVKTDTIRPYLESLAENGYNVSRITFNISGMGTLCKYMDKKIDDAIFLKVDRKGYEGALFIDSSMRQIYSDGFTASDEAERIKKISADIKSLTETAKSLGRSPHLVVLKDRETNLTNLFESHIDMPVRILGETDMVPGPAIPHNEVPYYAVGSAIQSLLPDAKSPNLLKKGIHEKQRPPYLMTVILLLVIVVTLAFYKILPLGVEEKRLEAISNQITIKKEEARKVETLKKEVEALSAEIATIKNFKDIRPSTLDILKELTSILPETAWLTKIRIKETTVEINGYATSATELLPRLETSKYFSKVEFASPTVRDKRMNSDRFRIRMEIEGIKEDEGE